jgi:hypothetical protein
MKTKTCSLALFPFLLALPLAAQQSPAPVYTSSQSGDNRRPIGSEVSPSGQSNNNSSVFGGILRAVTGEQDTSSISLDQLTRNWSPEARQAAEQMYQKYGAATEVSTERVVWRNAGPWLAVEVRNQTVPHNFPFPHQDVLRQTVALNVPPERIAELAQFSGSLVVDRTKGELSSHCDTEQNNLIALNLANDIVSGRLNAQQARSRFTELAQVAQQGQRPSYATGLQFSGNASNTAFPDGPGNGQNQQQPWQRIGW